MIKRRYLTLTLLFAAMLVACSESTVETKIVTPPEVSQPVQESENQTLSKLPSIQSEVTARWQETLSSAQALKEQVYKFSQAPSVGNLEAALTIWEQTHSSYSATRLLDYLNLPALPIRSDNEETVSHNIHVRLNQQPLLLGYLDAVQGYPQSGLLYTELPLTEANLMAEHQLGDPAYVAIGFHALKAVLEGDNALALTPQQRFEVTGKIKEPKINTRRVAYVQLLSDLILRDITTLHHAWTSYEGHYFLALRQLSAKDLENKLKRLIKKETDAIAALEQNPTQEVTPDTLMLRKAFLAAIQTLESATPNAIEVATP